MLVKHIFTLGLFLFSLITSANQCFEAYGYRGPAFKQADQDYFSSLTSVVRERKLPAFYRKIGDRKVPVLLLEESNYKYYQEYLDEGFAQVLALTGRGNDHGQLLIGAREMSERSFFGGVGREHAKHGLNDTGILVKDFSKTLQFNKNANYLIFHYRLTDYEKDIVKFYARTRRAGLFHVENGFNPMEPIPHAFQRICRGAEKCHNYISSTEVHQEQVNYMKFLLWKYAGEKMSADEILALDIVKRIQEKGRAQIRDLNLEAYYTKNVGEKGILYGQEEVLNPRMFNQEDFLILTQQILPANTDAITRVKFINSVVGVKALEEYKVFSRSLGVNKYDPWPDHINGSPRLSSIYVIHPDRYRGDPQAFLDSFYRGSYENFHGANHHHLGDWRTWQLPFKYDP